MSSVNFRSVNFRWANRFSGAKVRKMNLNSLAGLRSLPLPCLSQSLDLTPHRPDIKAGAIGS
jgi:hypothetical protein